jgi:hypothetical protein
VSAGLNRRLGLTPALPGGLAHTAKVLLAHYLVWKLRTGYTNLPGCGGAMAYFVFGRKRSRPC